MLPKPRAGTPLQTSPPGYPTFFSGKRRPRVIASDIWSFLLHYVDVESGLPQKDKDKALAYTNQAFEFYEAASSPRFGSRPLLYYYAYLNVTKAFLTARRVPLPPRARHGISDPKANVKQRLRLEGQAITVENAAADHSAILPEFIASLSPTRGLGRSYRVLDLLAQVPSIHRAYQTVQSAKSSSRLGKQWNQGPCFAPIRRFDLLSAGSQIWTVARLDASSDDASLVAPKLEAMRGFRATFTRVEPRVAGEIWYESTPLARGRRSLDPCISALAERIRQLGVWTVLTRDGYRPYLGAVPESKRVNQLVSTYAIMFYLGSITRYKPYDYDTILEGRYAWVVDEFLATQPVQFLYCLASVLVGAEVVRPFAVTMEP